MSLAASSQFYSNSISWKGYQLLKKKAMEQELSWSGLIISLSIAFFVVAGCAATMRMIADSFVAEQARESEYKNEQVIERIEGLNLAQGFFAIKTVEQVAISRYQVPLRISGGFGLVDGSQHKFFSGV